MAGQAYRLEVEPLNLGADVSAISLELLEREQRRPARGAEAARIWGAILPALAGAEPWTLDFFSHLERLREFSQRHEIAYRQAAARCIVITSPAAAPLQALLDRFAAETFGARAGGPLPASDAALEGDLARRGVDAYHHAFPSYLFCAVCDFENGFLTVLSNRLSASEVRRRVAQVVANLGVEVFLPA